MIDAEFVERIVELAREAPGKLHVVDGVTYSPVELHDLRQPDPEARTLHLCSLRGVVDYLEENIDGLNLDQHFLHIEGPGRVLLWSREEGRFHQRNNHLTASAHSPLDAGLQGGFRLGAYATQEAFVIGVQTAFVDVAQRRELLELVGNLTDESVTTSQDDGVTQKVSARAGISMKTERPIPNPFTLAPYRTFREVEQPASPFILRVRKTAEGIGIGLFEADGGTWKIEAVQRVREWLMGENVPVTIIS